MSATHVLFATGGTPEFLLGATPSTWWGAFGFDGALGTAVARLAWSQLWQVTVMVLIVAMVSRYLLARHPYVARGLWLLVLVK